MITVPPFVRRALRDWQLWREARQRQERFNRLLRINPELLAAQQALERDRKRHGRSQADLVALRAAMSDQLRREVHHG